MRKQFIFISLLTTMMVAFSSVAYSYYSEIKQTAVKEATCKAPKSDETMWELLTRKAIGLVSVSY